MENFTNVPLGEQNLRAERLIFYKCLIYRRSRLASWPMNICQESCPILKPMNLLLGLQLDFPIFVLLTHKYSHPKPSMNLPVACYRMHLLELHFLSYFQVNSISGNLSFPQFISLFRLTAAASGDLEGYELWFARKWSYNIFFFSRKTSVQQQFGYWRQTVVCWADWRSYLEIGTLARSLL